MFFPVAQSCEPSDGINLLPSAFAYGNCVLLNVEYGTFLNILMLSTVHRLAFAVKQTLELEKEMTCHTSFTRRH